ncbi:11216_t:CDS:2 [Rhizophagus irregularis]|nr:11216_t:CDS:2 [Rhizophagus irregularis]
MPLHHNQGYSSKDVHYIRWYNIFNVLVFNIAPVVAQQNLQRAYGGTANNRIVP